MSPQIINECHLARAIAELGWADIDQLVDYCEKHNVFGADFYHSAINKARKSAIRRMLRSGRLKDENGEIIKVASIRVTDANGKPRRIYKQEMLFSVGDCIQVANYWKDNVARCKNNLRYYVALATRLHGKTIQGLLPLVD